MSAQADYERHFFAAKLGRTQSLSVTDGGNELSTQLEPGRYLLHLQDDAGGRIFVKQGDSGVATVAATSDGSTPMHLSALGAFEFTVKNETDAFIAAQAVAGVTAVLHITKISAGKN